MLTRSKVVWQKALDGLSIRIKKYLFGNSFKVPDSCNFSFPFPTDFAPKVQVEVFYVLNYETLQFITSF